MKKLLSTISLMFLLCGIVAVTPVSQSQAVIVGGPCDTALDTYGGQNALWNEACYQYTIAINECIQLGDCDHYNP